MMRFRPILVAVALSAIFVVQANWAAADDVTIEDLAQDIVPVEIQLNVTYQVEHRFPVGDPPVMGRASTDVSFHRSAVHTLIRFKPGLGMDFAAMPGFLVNPEFPEVEGIVVRQTHTCVDDQTMPIGRETADLSASAEVHPASGGIMLSRADGPELRVRIAISPFEVETDFVDCPRENCFIYNFHFDGSVAEDKEQWVETEEGHLDYQGLELAVVNWELVKSIAEGGEVPLAIPVSVTRTEEIEADGEVITVVFTVTGAITRTERIPLAPLTDG